jgi:hypothetical protein
VSPPASILSAVASLLLVCTAADAQESPSPDAWHPETAAHLGGPHGLTGFGSMVDGRIPSPFLTVPQARGPLGSYSSRFALRYDVSVERQDLRGDLGEYDSRRQQHRTTATYGFTVQGLDVGIGVPLVQEIDRLGPSGGPNATDRTFGVGDLLVGLKVALRIPKFWFGKWAVAAFGPYALCRVPTGMPGLRDPAQIEFGVALAGPYGYSFRWNGNLAIRQRSGGLSALVYRFGGSAVPLASGGEVLRVYAHLSGVEYEGPPNSSVDLELGGQLLLGGLFTLDLGVAVRLVDAGLVDPQLDRRLEKDAGDRISGMDHKGTVAVTFGIGFVL